MRHTLQPHQLGLPAHNLLVNGDFEVWQRGAGPFVSSGSGVFSCDEWRAVTADSMTVQRTSDDKTGLYSAQISKTGTGWGWFSQGIEAYKSLEGELVTFSAWVKCSSPLAIALQVTDWDGVKQDTTSSNSHTGGGDWELLTVTRRVRSGIVPWSNFPHSFGMACEVVLRGAYSGLVDAAMLAVGAYPSGVPFTPLPPALEITRCRRYYQKATASEGNLTNFSGMVTSAGVYKSGAVRLTEMPATPTITLTNVANTGFATTVGSVTVGPQGFREQRTSNLTSTSGKFSSSWTAEVA